MSEKETKSTVVSVYAPGAPYLEPYFAQRFRDADLDFQSDYMPEMTCADYAVMVSSTDVYGNTPMPWTKGGDADFWSAREDAFVAAAAQGDVRHSILRCPPVVCTGMHGFCRTLVGKVNNGMFFHVQGLSPRLSVVHAVDIAEATALLMEKGSDAKVFDITDGVNPTIDDLAEAFAYRLDNKRIGVLKPLQAKFLMGPKYCRQLAAGLPEYSCEPLVGECGFKPTSVVEYLRTHDYGENSL